MSLELMDYDEVLEKYDPIFGLEVHVELNTATKMFCSCPNAFGADPNQNTCPICLGLPGTLPVLNQQGVESAIKVGLALGCEIASECQFARKHYFYADLSKNYQISQSDTPIAFNGQVEVDVDGEVFVIAIERAHMEEDAGKLVHIGATGRIHDAEYSLVDDNRAGTPLVEIVTKPVFGAGAKTPQVARAYVGLLRDMLKELGVSDVRMEQGSLRCDANVSLVPRGVAGLGTRTETKNINSLRSIENALRYEIRRHGTILAAGEQVKQETRHWHEEGFTSPGRSKETADDYRYFIDPDLVPVVPDPAWVQELRAQIPQSPTLRRKQLQEAWGFSDLELRDVVNAGALALIEATVAAGCTPTAARKWWMTELARRANQNGCGLDELAITPAQVAQLQGLLDAGVINDTIARKVIDAVLMAEGDPQAIVAAKGWVLTDDDDALNAALAKVIAANADAVAKIKDGKTQAIGVLIGAVMREMKGQADAAKIRDLILATIE
ncbi:MAG: Asp-tRNA(Asn)/Glu-tRNA(Gln) amidotransferase subunit GatB [Propionibacteriaceae bacterium]|nr:Asp-tRNA(Asn)/Glu-tRNA(Gln) amidotransferase subunit GatB [Propionibacteriaceae bacterium]